MTKKILVIDDDPNVGQILSMLLEVAGYETAVAIHGQEGLEKACEHYPDLVLLDIMLPDMDGWEVCHRLREVTDVPIIMLTVRSEDKEIVKGLKLGADDYITKPYSNRVLLARIRALLRRSCTSPGISWQDALSRAGLSFDLIQRDVIFGGKRLHLTHTEFRLLAYLARRIGQTVSRSELAAQIWGAELEQDMVCLRWHIHNLRQKIEKDPKNPQCLLGKYNVGYCFAGQH